MFYRKETPMSAITKRNSAITLLIVSLAILIYWWATSGSILTLTKVAVEKKDELFGTTYIEWQDGFKLGLEYTTAAVLPMLIASLFFYRSYRKQ
jgi:hypothetical protein